METNNNSHITITETLLEVNDVYKEMIDGLFKLDRDILEKIESMRGQALGKSFIKAVYMIMIAILTMEESDIENAAQAVEELSKLSNKLRRNSLLDKMMKIFKTPSYEKFTDMEAHAEMVHSFSIALKALISALNTYTFYGLIKVVYRMRKFLQEFEASKKILNKKKNWESEISGENFEAGVKLSNGICHLVISHIPPKILKVVNFFGYRGVESIAFECINKSAFELSGIYSDVARLCLISYWIYIQPHVGFQVKNLDTIAQILEKESQIHPNSVVFKLFNCKVEQISGHIDNAIKLYESVLLETKSIAHKAFHFELIWCYVLKSDLHQAVRYAELVRKGAPHSPTFCTYVEAVMRYVLSQEENDQNMKDKATELFKVVPTLRLRHLGKTITPEKIAVHCSEKYIDCGEFLILPEMELLYQGNWIYFIKGNQQLLDRLMKKVEKEQNKYRHELTQDFMDNYLATMFYKGVIHRLLGQFSEAKECFDLIIEEEGRIYREISIPPQTMCELGLLELQLGHNQEAENWLNACLNNYSHYYNENYVHFRAYSGLRELGISHSEHSADEQKLQEYQKEWLKENEVDKHVFDSIIESETKADEEVR